MKKAICFLLGLTVIIGALLACGSSDNNTGSSTGKSDFGKSTTDKSNSENKHFKAGEVVKVGDTWEITVNSFKVYTSTNEFAQPKEGKKFVLLDITAKNISSKEQILSSLLSFTLKDKEGRKADIAVVTDIDPAPDGKVEAGDKSRGNLSYEVVADQSSFALAFEADILSSGQVVWDLSL